ncbi:unnamed protein product, partial [Choristocarpus tenellus]
GCCSYGGQLVWSTCTRGGSPDRRAACLELEQIYGERAVSQRPMQLIAPEMKLCDMYCSSVEDTVDFVIRLDHIWTRVRAAGGSQDHAKKGALIIGIRDSMPQVF